MIQFKANFSRRILFQLILLTIFIGFILLINVDFLTSIYFKNQATNTGYIINGSILVLFAFGIFRVVSLLLRYGSEERSLVKFLRNVEKDQVRPIDNIRKKSLIAQRYQSVLEISKHNVAVNHSALASTLLATESTRLSLPRFISNILILTGVFGTIVSLSIALLGASNIIDSAEAISGMGIVIHGMSTALSTTTTAIVCYLFFGYFYIKLTDVQTQLLSGIEQATTLYIMPRFTYQTDSMLHEVGNLVRALREAAQNMSQTQIEYSEMGRSLNELSGSVENRLGQLGNDIDAIKQLLRSGFRLPD